MRNNKPLIIKYLNKFRLFFGLLFFALSGILSMANAFVVDGLSYTEMDTVTHTVYVSAANKDIEGDIIIPEKITYEDVEYSVTAVGSFAKCDKIVSVVIPNSVTNIFGSSFKWCSELTSVQLPNTIKKIPDQLFNQCSNLESVTIPDSVTLIEQEAFKGCSKLSPFYIPESVQAIQGNAFAGINTIVYAGEANGGPWGAKNRLSTVYDGDFIYSDRTKENLIGYVGTDSVVVIPEHVKTISADAFQKNNIVVSVSIPNSVTDIYGSSFKLCTNLTSVTLPNSLKKIPNQLFKQCYKLESVVIPDSVTLIEEDAFRDCRNLVSVAIPKSVDSIKNSAFYNCPSLTSVVLPDSLRRIENSLFCGCTSLESVIIPNTVTYIDYDAFRGCSSLTSIEIPNSVTFISSGVFYGCTSLTSLVIPESVTYLGYGSLGCGHLKSISIPNSDTLLETLSCNNHWFFDNGYDEEIFNEYGNAYYIGNAENPYLILMEPKIKDVSSIEIHPRCRVIYGYGTFYECTGRYLYLPDSLIGIGFGAFLGNGIAVIRVPSSLKWNDCECAWPDYKTTFVLDDPDSNIGDIPGLGPDTKLGVIKGDFVYSLDGKTIAAYIGESTSVTIPDSVCAIGWYAFYGCKDLTSVYIPASVEQMEWDVFKGCSAMMTKQDSIGMSDTTLTNAIYCRAEEQPVGWGDRWNPDSCKVVWGALSAPNSVGFRLVSSTANARIYGAEHSIVIENATNEVYVYTISGQLITRETSIQPITVIPMNKGVYTVKMGDMTKVVIVR